MPWKLYSSGKTINTFVCFFRFPPFIVCRQLDDLNIGNFRRSAKRLSLFFFKELTWHIITHFHSLVAFSFSFLSKLVVPIVISPSGSQTAAIGWITQVSVIVIFSIQKEKREKKGKIEKTTIRLCASAEDRAAAFSWRKGKVMERDRAGHETDSAAWLSELLIRRQYRLSV